MRRKYLKGLPVLADSSSRQMYPALLEMILNILVRKRINFIFFFNQLPDIFLNTAAGNGSIPLLGKGLRKEKFHRE